MLIIMQVVFNVSWWIFIFLSSNEQDLTPDQFGAEASASLTDPVNIMFQLNSIQF